MCNHSVEFANWQQTRIFIQHIPTGILARTLRVNKGFYTLISYIGAGEFHCISKQN